MPDPPLIVSTPPQTTCSSNSNINNSFPSPSTPNTLQVHNDEGSTISINTTDPIPLTLKPESVVPPSAAFESQPPDANTLSPTLNTSPDNTPASHSPVVSQKSVPSSSSAAPTVSSYYSALALRQIRQLSNSLPTSKDASNPASEPINRNSVSLQPNSSKSLLNFASFAKDKTLAIAARGYPPLKETYTSTDNKQSQNVPPGRIPRSASQRYSVSEKRFPSSASSSPVSSSPIAEDARYDYLPNNQESTTTPIPKYRDSEGGNESQVTADQDKINMHQSSSRLLRMTQDDRPFTKDFKDLFSTLIVSLPMNSHRLRFKTYPYSFTSDEAVNNLGSLKFSQSNRMPDPKDQSRIVTTTTTTTFSMAKEMARTVCQKFVAARFMEAVAEKHGTPFSVKNILWQLTPKGIHVLERFCQRNGINSPHIVSLLTSSLNTMKLVILERDQATDKLSHDKTTVEIIFRRFAGTTPNIKQSTNLSDSDSISEYADGTTGIRVAESRKIFDKVVKYSFTGKAAVDWLLDCCTTIEPLETHEIATLFLKNGLLQAVVEDKIYIQQNPRAKDFQPTKTSIYIITERGKRVCGWLDNERGSLDPGTSRSNGAPRNGEHGYNSTTAIANQGARPAKGGRGVDSKGLLLENRETNTTRLTSILHDAALRLLFREFLRETLCEENLSFWIDVQEFTKQFNGLNDKNLDNIRETLAAAYGIYNAFLAPGSPCELNIDHTLRQDLASRMTRAVAKDEASMYSSLKEVAILFERAQEQVFKLMAGDSVPKFARTNRYIEVSGDNISEDDRSSAEHSPPARPERALVNQ